MTCRPQRHAPHTCMLDILVILLVALLATTACKESEEDTDEGEEESAESEEFTASLAAAHAATESLDWNAANKAFVDAVAVGEEHGASAESIAYARHAIEATANPTVSNDHGMKFVLMPAGTFRMGSASGSKVADDDETSHEAVVDHLVYMGTTEVTQAQWARFMDENPSRFKGENLPVDSVTLEQARAFAAALSESDDEANYRLPSETEWEFACRAGTTTPYSMGRFLTAHTANINDKHASTNSSGLVSTNKEQTIDVGSYAPNPWGLYDMHGNVWEWVEDAYGSYPTTGSQAAVEPPGDGSGKNILRGGAWNFSPEAARCAARLSIEPDKSYDVNGFRLVREVSAPE